eukprot:NODE_44_length_33449_cov_1.575742.p7 type:complete len:395 gc:universal NODE_44_length_33449_cov_1.575742:18736-19920(+)
MGSSFAATIIGIVLIYRLDKILNFTYLLLKNCIIYEPYTIEEYFEKLKMKKKQLEFDIEASYKDISNIGLRGRLIQPKNYIIKTGALDNVFFFEQFQQLTLFSYSALLVVMLSHFLEMVFPNDNGILNLNLGITWSLFALFIQILFMALSIEDKSQLIMVGLAATQGFFVASLFTIHTGFGQPLKVVFQDFKLYLSGTTWATSMVISEKYFLLFLTLYCAIVSSVLTVPSLRKFKTYLISTARETDSVLLSMLHFELLSPLMVVISLLYFKSSIFGHLICLIDITINFYLFKSHAQWFLNLAKIKTASIALIPGKTKVQIFINTIKYLNGYSCVAFVQLLAPILLKSQVYIMYLLRPHAFWWFMLVWTCLNQICLSMVAIFINVVFQRKIPIVE